MHFFFFFLMGVNLAIFLGSPRNSTFSTVVPCNLSQQAYVVVLFCFRCVHPFPPHCIQTVWLVYLHSQHSLLLLYFFQLLLLFVFLCDIQPSFSSAVQSVSKNIDLYSCFCYLHIRLFMWHPGCFTWLLFGVVYGTLLPLFKFSCTNKLTTFSIKLLELRKTTSP